MPYHSIKPSQPSCQTGPAPSLPIQHSTEVKTGRLGTWYHPEPNSHHLTKPFHPPLSVQTSTKKMSSLGKPKKMRHLLQATQPEAPTLGFPLPGLTPSHLPAGHLLRDPHLCLMPIRFLGLGSKSKSQTSLYASSCGGRREDKGGEADKRKTGLRVTLRTKTELASGQSLGFQQEGIHGLREAELGWGHELEQQDEEEPTQQSKPLT